MSRLESVTRGVFVSTHAALWLVSRIAARLWRDRRAAFATPVKVMSGAILKWTLIALAIVAALFVLDRILRWAEDRGWIYYRTRTPTLTSVATALFQAQAIVQPEKQHIVEAKREIKEDEDEDGDGKPKPGPPRSDVT